MTIIQAEAISHSFRGTKVLDNVSISAEGGIFYALTGPNGSGKSTLLRILAGLLRPDSGHVCLNKHPLDKLKTAEIARNIALLLPSAPVPPDFTVNEIVLMGRAPHLAWWKEYTMQDKDKAESILKKLSIDHLKDRGMTELSSGERQKVFIAQALCQAPDIMLLDEPTSHLDINHRIEIFSLLAALSKAGMTTIIISHDLNTISQFCDRIMLLRNGKIVADGTPETAITPDTMKQTYGVECHVSVTDGRPVVSGLKLPKQNGTL